MEHKYSTWMLVFLFSLFIIGYASSVLVSDDLDYICNTNKSLIKRISGTWVCSVTHHAELKFYNNDTPDTITISEQNTFYNITGFLTDDLEGITRDNDALIITKNSLYKIDVRTSFSGGNSGDYELVVFINDVLDTDCLIRRTTSATDINSASLSCLKYLVVDDVIHLRVMDKSTPVQDFNIYTITFNIMEVQ